MKLSGKTIVLTGASGGIGQAIARRLAAAGARLVLTGRQKSALDTLCESLDNQDQGHLVLPSDLATVEGRSQLVSFCEELINGPDILINAAGVGSFDLLQDQDESEIEHLFQMNAIAPIWLTHALLPMLARKPEAAIVNIGSVFGYLGHPGFALYCSSKFAIRGFSEALGRELKGGSVKVLHLAPRATDTPLNDSRIQGFNREMKNRVDSPELVAEQLYLCLVNGRWGSRVIGQPERLFTLLNALFPTLIDHFIGKSLGAVERYARGQRVDIHEQAILPEEVS